MSPQKRTRYLNQDKAEYERKFKETKERLRREYLEDIKRDHEEDEIRECMMLYEKNLDTRTRLMIWDPFEYENHLHDVEWKFRNNSLFRFRISLISVNLLIILFFTILFCLIKFFN